ncbi:MAG: A24 family peptidase [Methanosarcinales archaeon]|jgi:Flp pilus assembly protein protease CpaA|nr:A24 family peptidase [Methanosarcinales archaeon]
MNLAEIFPEFLSFIFLFKSAVFLFLLLIASVQDVRTQTVSDRVWIVGFFFILPMIIVEIFIIGFSRLLDIFISMGFFFLFSLVCFSLRFFGGADCKAFLFLSILFPFESSGFLNSLSFSVLFNSLFLSLIFSIFYILKESKIFKQPVSISAEKFSAVHALKLRLPFLPAITGGFILSLCDVNLFLSLFSFFF